MRARERVPRIVVEDDVNGGEETDTGKGLERSSTRRSAGEYRVRRQRDLTTRAGRPTASDRGGISRVTTLPAPMTLWAPIVTARSTMTRDPSQTFSSRMTGADGGMWYPPFRLEGVKVVIHDDRVGADGAPRADSINWVAPNEQP